MHAAAAAADDKRSASASAHVAPSADELVSGNFLVRMRRPTAQDRKRKVQRRNNSQGGW